MKIFASIVCLFAFLALSGCTTETRKQMRMANELLQQSEQQMIAGDWAQSLALAKQATEGVKLGIEARPVRKGANGEPLELSPLLAAWMSGPNQALLTALEAKQKEPAIAAYAASRQQCSSCHTAIGRNDIAILTAGPQ